MTTPEYAMTKLKSTTRSLLSASLAASLCLTALAEEPTDTPSPAPQEEVYDAAPPADAPQTQAPQTRQTSTRAVYLKPGDGNWRLPESVTKADIHDNVRFDWLGCTLADNHKQVTAGVRVSFASEANEPDQPEAVQVWGSVNGGEWVQIDDTASAGSVYSLQLRASDFANQPAVYIQLYSIDTDGNVAFADRLDVMAAIRESADPQADENTDPNEPTSESPAIGSDEAEAAGDVATNAEPQASDPQAEESAEAQGEDQTSPDAETTAQASVILRPGRFGGFDGKPSGGGGGVSSVGSGGGGGGGGGGSSLGGFSGGGASGGGGGGGGAGGESPAPPPSDPASDNPGQATTDQPEPADVNQPPVLPDGGPVSGPDPAISVPPADQTPDPSEDPEPRPESESPEPAGPVAQPDPTDVTQPPALPDGGPVLGPDPAISVPPADQTPDTSDDPEPQPEPESPEPTDPADQPDPTDVTQPPVLPDGDLITSPDPAISVPTPDPQPATPDLQPEPGEQDEPDGTPAPDTTGFTNTGTQTAGRIVGNTIVISGADLVCWESDLDVKVLYGSPISGGLVSAPSRNSAHTRMIEFVGGSLFEGVPQMFHNAFTGYVVLSASPGSVALDIWSRADNADSPSRQVMQWNAQIQSSSIPAALFD